MFNTNIVYTRAQARRARATCSLGAGPLLSGVHTNRSERANKELT